MRLRPKIVTDVLSGFLGSGKTTLLRQHLASITNDAAVGVIINEFGATAIDHRLMRQSRDAPRVVAAGCACCAVADELRETFLELLGDDARGAIPPVERIVLETSGLADPASILSTLRGDITLAEYIDDWSLRRRLRFSRWHCLLRTLSGSPSPTCSRGCRRDHQRRFGRRGAPSPMPLISSPRSILSRASRSLRVPGLRSSTSSQDHRREDNARLHHPSMREE